MINSFYTNDELTSLKFKSIGNNVFISRNARFYDPETIEIGSNVRIDDFCILSGNIKLGSFIHISAYSALYGHFGIEMENYTGLSPRCMLFSASDDFSGEHMISPMAPEEYTKLTTGKILIKRFSQIGAGTIVSPNVTVSEGVAVGAMSFVKKNLDPWMIYAGVPAKPIKERSRKILTYPVNDDM